MSTGGSPPYSSTSSNGAVDPADGVTRGYSSITGGNANSASGVYATVSGGYFHGVTGKWNWQAGDALFQDQ